MRSVLKALGVAVALMLATHPVLAQNGPVETRESQYNTIIVERSGSYVLMMFGYNRRLYTESLANMNDPLELPADYTQSLTVAVAYAANRGSLLEIGLGGGTTSWYLHQTYPDLDISIVELDPDVIELAQKYFFITPGERLEIVARDGRIFLVRSEDTYDMILIDAYRGPFVPFHLLTREFFQIAKSRLAPGGVIAQNVEPTTMLYDSAVATIRSVFENVDVYPAGGNYVVIAYDGPPKTQQELLERAAAIEAEANPRYSLTEMLQQREIVETVAGQVLTDDFAPVETLNATERYNERLPEPRP